MRTEEDEEQFDETEETDEISEEEDELDEHEENILDPESLNGAVAALVDMYYLDEILVALAREIQAKGPTTTAPSATRSAPTRAPFARRSASSPARPEQPLSREAGAPVWATRR